ncbi:MAG: methyl-accepting chemotaxis protein [Hylemonella sp.]|nr:methyl-accepting chemotaxis protein [Hylemonella sp.]MDP1936204.1 methyl-accepting chemotaxis protein [Hylemonella sp.]
MLDKFKISQRFMAVVVLYWLAFAVVLTVSIWGLRSAKNSLEMVHLDAMKPALLAEASVSAIQQNRMQVLLAFQHAPDGPLASIHDHPTSQHTDAIAANRVRANEIFKQIENSVASAEEKALLEAARTAREPWRVKLDTAVKAILAGDFSPPTMAAFLKAGREEGEAAVKALVAFREFQVKQAEEAAQDAGQRYRLAWIVFILVMVLGGIPGTLLTVLLMRRIRAGFGLADATATAIAQGDLSRSVPFSGSDEIGRLLQLMEDMRQNLHRVISEVQHGSDAIASAATQVAAGTLDLSNRTEQQAGSLEQTASASEELSSTVQHNAENAGQANQLAASASQVASRGGVVMTQVVQTMDDINTSSRKIADIISVIDGIAFQTNILALNAAVEAARAGEQGRGFAVVAGEVRALAGRSAEAAREIKSLIEDSVAKVGVGSEQVAQAGATMQEIVGGIKRVADIVGEIASASREQSAGIGQINSAVTQLDEVTQQNAALVEETSAASGSLQEQARQLAQLASSFKLNANQAQAGHAPRLTQQ